MGGRAAPQQALRLLVHAPHNALELDVVHMTDCVLGRYQRGKLDLLCPGAPIVPDVLIYISSGSALTMQEIHEQLPRERRWYA